MLSDLIFLLKDFVYYKETCEICQTKFKRERWKIDPKTRRFTDENKKCSRCEALKKPPSYSVFMKYVEEEDRRLENIREFKIPLELSI